MTRERFDLYRELRQELEQAADALLDRYRAVRKDVLGALNTEPDQCLGFQSIDEETIRYEGDEWWSYGGHEHHVFELPLHYLFDPDVDNVIRLAAENERKVRDRQKKAKAEQEIAKEKQLLHELQAKYGSIQVTQ